MSSNKLNLSQLPVEQVANFKKQLQEETERLSVSMETLLALIEKFNNCIESIKEVTSSVLLEDSETEMLIPVTNSLYITGKKNTLKKNKDKFIVDIGTGYFIEKTGKEAIDYYERKINNLKLNYTKINDIIKERTNTIKVLDEDLAKKLGTQPQASQLANKDGLLLK
ncbi:hypothetical protein QEN19_003538 [Hanseniaspora menglaensis]